MANDLAQLVDRYWEQYLALNPTAASAAGDRRFDARLENSASLSYLADSLALERAALTGLAKFHPELLDAEARLTYEVFKAEREAAVEGYLYPQELLPVEPFDSMPQLMARLGAGEGAQPFDDAKGYEDWLGRINGYTAWTEQAIANLREGMRRGYLLPRVLVERLLPQLQELSRDRSESRFLRPLQRFPAGIDAASGERLSRALQQAVRTQLLPAYRELYEFLRTEYLPRSRTSIGLSALPMGERWYDYRVRRVLGNTASAARVQAQALAEVQRQQARLGELAAQSGFGGNLPGFLTLIRQEPRFHFQSAADMLDTFQRAAPTLASAARGAVPTAPRAQPQILPQADAALADGEQVRYVALASPQGAALLVDTGSWQRGLRSAVPAILLSEDDPGRHLQRSIQVSQAALPRFRRFGRVPAFERAWATYAGSLGEELGAFTEPDARVGALLTELRQALLAVVDIEVHAKGWSRQQAIDYLRERLPIEEPAAALAVDRCIAEPAAALAPALGAAAIRALRARAQAALGAQFDAHAFHVQILAGGAMPLEVLERQMEGWIKAQPH